jgi:hypothetical protein
MENSIADLLAFCSRIDFGPVNLSEEEKEFSEELNREILLLCKSLPKSTQTEAALFLLRYLRVSLSDGVNFVGYFYPPAWSILYWLMKSKPGETRLDQTDIQNAKTGHTMAMFLHAIDDHLADHQVPVTHLTLLLRSQSWMVMNYAFGKLATAVDRGTEIVDHFIDDYYWSIYNSDGVESLDSYCGLFRKQMATALIVPVLVAKRRMADEEFVRSIRAAYESFGIAWRLLDDLQDIEKDMMKGVHSSIYVCLNEDLRGWWDKDTEEKKNQNNDYVRSILSYVLEKRVIDSIKERACRELESAASIADSYSMPGLADELRCLLKPLRNGWNRS